MNLFRVGTKMDTDWVMGEVISLSEERRISTLTDAPGRGHRCILWQAVGGGKSRFVFTHSVQWLNDEIERGALWVTHQPVEK